MLPSLATHFIWRDLRRNPLRAGLTILGIALGVAIWLAIHLANETVLGRFEESLDRIAGRTNLQVVATGQPAFSETLLTTIQPLLWEAQAEVTPVIMQTAVWPGGNHDVIQVQGMDMLADTGFRDYAWAPDGKPTDAMAIFQAPTQNGVPTTSAALHSQQNYPVFLGYQLAQAYHIQRGQTISLLVNDTRQRFYVAGILSEKGVGGAYSGNTVYMDIGTAQQAFRLNGRINRMDVVAPKEHLKAIQAKLEKALPGYLSVQRPTRNNEQVERMLRAFQTNLMSLSFIALLVSMFLIYNTMSIAVIRRRPEIGTLRALGVPRRAIGTIFLTEAGLFGLLGSLGGVALGIGLAQGAVKAISLTVETLYLGYPIRDLLLQPISLASALALGIGLTLLAALPSVWEAASVSPAESVRRAGYESRIMRLTGPLAAVGLLLGVISGVAAMQPALFNFPVFGYLAALLLILGVALLLPWLLQRSLPWIARVLHRLGGEEGRLSAVLLSGALGRTSVAIASLTIGIAMMVSLAVMIASFRETVVVWVNQTLKADLWVEAASRSNSRQSGSLSPHVVRLIQRTPGVAAIDPFGEFAVEIKGEPANVGVGSMAVFSQRGHVKFLDGGSTRQRTLAVLHSKTPAGFVTESFAIRHHVGQGQTVTLNTPHGPLPVKIMGVYYDYSSEQGYLIIDHSLYERAYGQAVPIASVAVYLKSHTNAQAVRQAIFKAVRADTQLTMRTNQELRAEVLRIFDNTFAITYALHVIAIVVAILGILNTLFALVVEAKREFGILKYLGASPKQIRKIVLMQAGLLGLLGNVTGLGVGLLLALLLIFVINKQSFGWTVQWMLPLPFLSQSFVLVLLTAVFSGWIPAKMAAKTLAPEVVRAE